MGAIETGNVTEPRVKLSTETRPVAVTTLGPDDLRIEKIETTALRAPLSRRFEGSGYAMDHRCTIVVRLWTADGIVSETYSGDTDEEQDRIVDIIHDELAPRVLGRSARDPEGMWQAMKPSTNNILRDRGVALQAIAALDTGVWDVFGRAVGLPLYRIWGALTDTLPVSVIGGYYHLDLSQTAEMIQRYHEMGFAGCKFKVGGRSPAEDSERTRVARAAAGPEFAIMCDANQGFSHDEAIEFAQRVKDIEIRWLEEPCSWDNDRRWMRDVRFQTGIPVCAGQSEVALRGLRDLVVEGAIDVSNFDASWCGGPTVWRKAAGLCAAFGVELGHHEEPQIASHLLASVPNSTYVEVFDDDRDPFFWHLTDMSSRLTDGVYRLSDRPGFGIDFDWDYVEAHSVGTRVTKFGEG